MGQTSELEDKLSVLVLPGGTVKDADDISNGLCVGARRMTQSRLLVKASTHCWATLFKHYSKKGRGRKNDNEGYSQNEGGGEE